MPNPMDLLGVTDARNLYNYGVSKLSGWQTPETPSDLDALLSAIFLVPLNPGELIGREGIEGAMRSVYPTFRRRAVQATRHLAGDPTNAKYAAMQVAEESLPKAIVKKDTGEAAVQEFGKRSEDIHAGVADEAIRQGKFSPKAIEDLQDYAGLTDAQGRLQSSYKGDYDFGYYSPDLNKMLDYRAGDQMRDKLWQRFMTERFGGR